MILLTKSNTFIIGPISQLLGYIIDLIYKLGVTNIGLAIIIFTIILFVLMLPLNYKQQKFSKINAVMGPELKEIQKKYEGKKDQQSIMLMREEQQALYAKYGVSQSGGCIQSLVTLPILFGFYNVIRNIPAYIPALQQVYKDSGIISSIMSSSDAVKDSFIEMAKNSPVLVKITELNDTKIIDALWKFDNNLWSDLKELIPSSSEAISTTIENLKQYTTFLCYNIVESPKYMFTLNWSEKNYILCLAALLIPVLAGVSQWLSIAFMPKPTTQDDMTRQLNSMNYIMPLFSVFFSFTLPIGLGLYWIASAICRTIQTICINKYMSKKSLEELIGKQREKMEAKLAKKGISKGNSLRDIAQSSTKSINIDNSKTNNSSTGTLAEKARMVQKFNENNK